MSGQVRLRRLPAVGCAVLIASLIAALPVHAAAAPGAPTISKIRPATGPTTGGTQVQIVGTGFTNVHSVTFGATAAYYTVASDHASLIATAPARATTGAVNLTVTTSSGSAARASAFRYTDPWPAHSYTAPQTIDSPVDSPAVLSCPGTHCYGMDDFSNFLDSGSGNGRWINRHHPPGDGSPVTKSCQADDQTCASLSCPAVGYCVSVNDSGQPLIWSGGSWHSYPSLDPAGVHTFDHTPFVSCATSSFCVVFDAKGDYSVWDGTGWSQPRTVDGTPVTSAADESTFGMASVSCAGSECVMTNGLKARRYDAGAWSAPVGLGGVTGGQNSLSCANVAHTGTSLLCVVGFANGENVYSHGTWRGADHRFGTFGISCRADGRCLAMDDDNAHVYVDGKRSNSSHGWSGPFPIPTGHRLGFEQASACKAGLNCLASITNGYAATFNIATHKWTKPGSILAPSLGISAIGCANRGQGAVLCLAGDVGPWLTSGTGSNWTRRVKAFGPGEQAVAVSCVHRAHYFCMALANNNRYATKNNHYATYSGHQLQVHSMITGTFKSLACWSETGCYAVSETKVLRWNGSVWSVAVDLAKRHLHFVAITCLPGKPGCLAVARNSAAYWVNGTRLSAPFAMHRPGAGGPPTAVACQDPHHCVGVIDAGGTFYSDSNRHWVIQGRRSGYRPFLAAACAPSATTARCLAVGYGDSTTWDGAVGHVARAKLPGQTAVSCPDTDVCVVGDTMGRIQRY